MPAVAVAIVAELISEMDYEVARDCYRQFRSRSDFGLGEMALWEEWLESHLIDPVDVSLPGWIERRVTDRQIRYQSYLRGDDGLLQSPPSGTFAQRAVIPIIRTVQLESPPKPFPVP